MLRTSVDAGPEKRRRRFTAAPRPLIGTMRMTTAQVAAFETFFRTTLADGTLAFDFPHPRTQSTLSVVFASPPSWTNAGGDYYDVILPLEIQP